MNQQVIELWADIGSADTWADLVGRSSVFVPFADRWPQPGFVGARYFDQDNRIVVMGQNPRASNTPRASASDAEMFELIRRHAEQRTEESLLSLFAMMRAFMLGLPPYAPEWPPIRAARRHLVLNLDAHCVSQPDSPRYVQRSNRP